LVARFVPQLGGTWFETGREKKRERRLNMRYFKIPLFLFYCHSFILFFIRLGFLFRYQNSDLFLFALNVGNNEIIDITGKMVHTKIEAVNKINSYLKAGFFCYSLG